MDFIQFYNIFYFNYIFLSFFFYLIKIKKKIIIKKKRICSGLMFTPELYNYTEVHKNVLVHSKKKLTFVSKILICGPNKKKI